MTEQNENLVINQESYEEPLDKAAAYARLMGQQINSCVTNVHGQNVRAGWWTDINTGLRKERNCGELLMLCVSELAEAMEGDRKNLMDDKLPHRKMIEVELADAIIRIFDMAGGLNLDLGGAFAEKLLYNQSREDHKIENRLLDDGKKY